MTSVLILDGITKGSVLFVSRYGVSFKNAVSIVSSSGVVTSLMTSPLSSSTVSVETSPMWDVSPGIGCYYTSSTNLAVSVQII